MLLNSNAHFSLLATTRNLKKSISEIQLKLLSTIAIASDRSEILPVV